MRAVLLRSLVVIGVGGLLLAGLLYVASTVDGRAPEVLAVTLTQPRADHPDQGLITTSIEIAFSEPVDPADAASALRLEPRVDGTVSGGGSTLIFTPDRPLELETEYTLTIARGIRDLAGNEMTESPQPYVFVTAGRPELIASEPRDGAGDVAVDAPIELVFSGLMDTASVEAALELEPAVAYEVRWSEERLEIVPSEPLEPATDYTVRMTEGATDVAGVPIGGPIAVEFRTVAPGLATEWFVPADGVDGVSPRSPIAIAFDRPLDTDSIGEDLLEITPSVAGSLDVVAAPGESPEEATILRFTPSAPLPPNTTFEVVLTPGIRAEGGGVLAEPVAWQFTTGAPQATLSNQVLFLSERSGVANVWAMNPDGTGQHQVSAELTSVLDYAIAPTGSTLVVADGRRLVAMRADGSDRRELTDAAHLEFDPAFAPDGSHVAFARADAVTGRGLGLWTWELGAGSATRVELPSFIDPRASPTASPTDDGDAVPSLRAPRYSPDGQALAFVDTAGQVGILELPAQRLTMVDARAAGAVAWDGRSSALLVPLGTDDALTAFAPPVAPLRPADAVAVGIIRRSGTDLDDAERFVARRIAVAPDGRVGWIDRDGVARIAADFDEDGTALDVLAGTTVTELAFGPVEDVVIVVIGGDGDGGRVERVDVASGERTRLVPDGWQVRWLP